MIQNNEDWEITADGLFIATRSYLIKRGYCCANRCRNCPYINWRNKPEWQPISHECIKNLKVSRKSVAGARALLDYHQQEIQNCSIEDKRGHEEMIRHYRLLLKQWQG